MKRVPQLDGVRGIAILVVMLHNQRFDFPSLHLPALFAHGWMGVDLFFALSGFLITGILLDAEASPGYFTNFYARRCLRIWPLYYAVLLVMFLAVPLARPSMAAPTFERSHPWWSYLFYVQNFVVAAPTSAVGPLAVTWSLAVEEQFYLAWPWVAKFCSRAQLCVIAAGVIVISPLLRIYLGAHEVDLYANTFCRLDGIMWGALLAVATRSASFQPAKLLRAAWASLVVGAALALAAATLHMGWIVYSLSAFASIAFIYLALFSPDRWLQRLVAHPFLVYTGVISYGLYLLHKLPFDVAKSLPLDRYAVVALPAMLGICYALATASWVLYERPFLELKRFFVSNAARRVPRADTVAVVR
jgi:peptidoglycan/LPS O-acetylase OafA/YrhL